MKGFAVTVTPARRRALLAQAPETPLVPPLGGPGAAAAEARRLPSSYTWAVSFTVQTGLVASGHASAAGLASSIASSLTSGLAAAVQTDLGLAVTVAQVDTAVENTRAPTKEPTAGPTDPPSSPDGTAIGEAAAAADSEEAEGADEAKSPSSELPLLLLGAAGGGALGLCLAFALAAVVCRRPSGNLATDRGAALAEDPEAPAVEKSSSGGNGGGSSDSSSGGRNWRLGLDRSAERGSSSSLDEDPQRSLSSSDESRGGSKEGGQVVTTDEPLRLSSGRLSGESTVRSSATGSTAASALGRSMDGSSVAGEDGAASRRINRSGTSISRIPSASSDSDAASLQIARLSQRSSQMKALRGVRSKKREVGL